MNPIREAQPFVSEPGLRVDILFPRARHDHTSALQKSFYTAATPAATLTQRNAAKKKIEKYGAAAAEASIDFAPLAVDTFGCWCEAGETFLRLVATRWRLDMRPSQAIPQLFKLSVCLARGVANVLLSAAEPPPVGAAAHSG